MINYSDDINTVQMLINKGADVNDQDNNGQTALNWATRLGHDQVAKILIDNNADLNFQDNQGFTPLIWAAIQSNFSNRK